MPHTVLAGAATNQAAAEAAAIVPLLAERVQVNGQPTAYVCESFACQMPATEPAVLAQQLGVRQDRPER